MVQSVTEPINKCSACFRRGARDARSTPRTRLAFRGFVAFLVAHLALAGVLMATPVEGQEIPTGPAAEVLAEIRARYSALPSLRARFDQTYVHRLHQSTQRWRGRITLRRPSKLRIDYDEPRGRVVVSDGTTLIAYDPDPSPGVY